MRCNKFSSGKDETFYRQNFRRWKPKQVEAFLFRSCSFYCLFRFSSTYLRRFFYFVLINHWSVYSLSILIFFQLTDTVRYWHDNDHRKMNKVFINSTYRYIITFYEQKEWPIQSKMNKICSQNRNIRYNFTSFCEYKNPNIGLFQFCEHVVHSRGQN